MESKHYAKGMLSLRSYGCLRYGSGIQSRLTYRESRWWNKPISAFQKQISTFCQLCSVCIPLKPRRDRDQKDDISASNLELLKNSPRIKWGWYILFDENQFKLVNASTIQWQPERYRRPTTFETLYASCKRKLKKIH